MGIVLDQAIVTLLYMPHDIEIFCIGRIEAFDILYLIEPEYFFGCILVFARGDTQDNEEQETRYTQQKKRCRHIVMIANKCSV